MSHCAALLGFVHITRHLLNNIHPCFSELVDVEEIHTTHETREMCNTNIPLYIESK